MDNLAVPGFTASAVAVDIKGKGDGNLDMGLIVCEPRAAAAGVFTKNSMAAAPVLICRERILSGRAGAILVNSGNANCSTGEGGMTDAIRLCRRAGEMGNIPEEEVLMCSTGVIGGRLPADRMERALSHLFDNLSPDGLEQFSRAILTTDTRPKTDAVDLVLGSGEARIAGVAKGAGMIAPNMATMLAFVFTDARIPAAQLNEMITESVGRSFNNITVDGDTSTNDTVLLLASGVGPTLDDESDRTRFQQGLNEICSSLAEQIVADGEGTKKVVQISVLGAADDADADLAARAVAQSLLVKTALAAADPNWGRLVAAVGYSGALSSPEKISLNIGDVAVLRNGEPVEGYEEMAASEVMRRDRYTIEIDLGEGTGQQSILTTDLTEEYVRINSEYRT